MSSITINSNVASLNAQRRLGQTTHELRLSFERLSSGLRINRARDDAAGLAISSSLDTDRRVFHQGIRNFNDGISAIDIADSALNELSQIVTRLAELAEQAANGTIGPRQRSALDQEAQELGTEYLRIAQTTKFNGLTLFDGSTESIRFQGGYGENGAIIAGVGGAIGDGTFAQGTVIASGSSGIWGVELGDLNGDGFADIITQNYTADIMGVHLGRGDGSFSSMRTFAAPSSPLYGPKLEVSDFNGDGVLDLMTVDRPVNAFYALIGNGDGTFRAGVSYAAAASDVRAGDMNGDGIIDIIGVDQNTDVISVMLGNGNGSFRATVTYGPDLNLAPQGLDVGDVNNDGFLDVVVSAANGAPDQAGIFLGNGDGTLRARTTFQLPESMGYAVNLADLNRDGNSDLVVGNNSALSILLGNGDGSFRAGTTYAAATLASEMTVGDLNGDGLLDVAVASYGTAQFSVHIGRGDGTLYAAQMYSTSYGSDITAGDIDGDGVLDLVTSNYAGSVDLHLGNSNQGVGPLLPFSLKYMHEARQALPVFTTKLQQLARQRGTIGAFHSRLVAGVSNLDVTALNIGESASRIRDVDVSEEAARLVRTNILQRASAAILAQANQGPALALSLLAA